MASRTQNRREGRHDRARIRVLLEQGLSLSKIAKATGISYAHVKQVAAQERDALKTPEEMNP